MKHKVNKYCITSILVILIGVITFNFTTKEKRNYISLNQESNLNMTNYNTMAYMIENKEGKYEKSKVMPGKGYYINEKESYCYLNDKNEHDENVELKTIDGIHTFSNITKNEKCYVYFERDKEAPVIEKVETNTSGTSITVTITANDNIGVEKYYYVIDNQTPIEKDKNTYTFIGLTAGQSYEITVYAKDSINNESEKVTKTVTIATGETTLAKLEVTVSNGLPDFSKVAGVPTGYTANEGYYYTYAESYEYNSATQKYSLVNPQVCKYSECYRNLRGKYIVSLTGHTSSGAATSTNLSTIYKVSLDTALGGFGYWDLAVPDLNSGVFSSEDDDGTSYYFRGNVTNNYLKFAGFWWRIIRINGDGTIRIIYDGTEYHANGTSTIDSIAIKNVMFNSEATNAENVGFKYTANTQRGLSNKSTILSELEGWYRDNLASYSDKIDVNAGFCGDRAAYTNESGLTEASGYGYATQKFGSFVRVFSHKAPDLRCYNEDDLYTISVANKGNKSLEYPIGLPSADELSFAGRVYNSAGGYCEGAYTCNGNYFWTMSPLGKEAYAIMMGADPLGYMVSPFTNSTYYGARPVINIRADVELTGSGTGTDPYVVVGAE